MPQPKTEPVTGDDALEAGYHGIKSKPFPNEAYTFESTDKPSAAEETAAAAQVRTDELTAAASGDDPSSPKASAQSSHSEPKSSKPSGKSSD